MWQHGEAAANGCSSTAQQSQQHGRRLAAPTPAAHQPEAYVGHSLCSVSASSSSTSPSLSACSRSAPPPSAVAPAPPPSSPSTSCSFRRNPCPAPSGSPPARPPACTPSPLSLQSALTHVLSRPLSRLGRGADWGVLRGLALAALLPDRVRCCTSAHERVVVALCGHVLRQGAAAGRDRAVGQGATKHSTRRLRARVAERVCQLGTAKYITARQTHVPSCAWGAQPLVLQARPPKLWHGSIQAAEQMTM